MYQDVIIIQNMFSIIRQQFNLELWEIPRNNKTKTSFKTSLLTVDVIKSDAEGLLQRF